MSYFNTDIPELSGFDTGLCLSNLSILEQRQNRLQESLLAILSELADAILSDSGEDTDTVDSILLSLLSRTESELSAESVPIDVSPVNREDLRRLTAQMGITARMTLYTMLEKRRNASEKIPPSPVLPTARGRIAYMPSAFADKAYLVLSPLVFSPRAGATAGFVDACEEVASGLCQYCILPIENSQSGKLTAFTRLILRYRLRIVAVCDLEDGAAEGQVTRFALLTSAHLQPAFPPLPEQKADTLLEIIHLTGPSTLCEMLVAAQFCGLQPLHISTVPLSETDFSDGSEVSTTAIDCVFDAKGADLATFRRYLSLEAPESFCAGLYAIHNPTV